VLLDAQNRLAATLPPTPELALLSAALTSRRLAWPEEANLLGRLSRYEERVDLGHSLARWDAEAAKLDAAADAAVQGAGLPAATAHAATHGAPNGARLAEVVADEASAAALNTVRAAIWRADARAWRDLGALSRATYQIELRGQGAGPDWLQARVHQFYQEGRLDREWVIRAGETRQLEAAVLGWRYDRLALAAGAILLAALVGFALLWVFLR
jgi:hypothetical protein